ncbi:7659_t:CDS:2, partial [Gigaspora rosea]
VRPSSRPLLTMNEYENRVPTSQYEEYLRDLQVISPSFAELTVTFLPSPLSISIFVMITIINRGRFYFSTIDFFSYYVCFSISRCVTLLTNVPISFDPDHNELSAHHIAQSFEMSSNLLKRICIDRSFVSILSTPLPLSSQRPTTQVFLENVSTLSNQFASALQYHVPRIQVS